MSYKGKYNKLVEAIKVLQETNPSDECLQNWVNDNVPELKESEDEKVRKMLIRFFEAWNKTRSHCWGISVNKILAWLEKQGEQKQEEQPRYNIGDILCDLSCNEYDKNAQLKYEIIDIKNGTYICDNGSIPVSQQDEYKLVAKKGEPKPIKVSNDEDSVSNELREASFIFAARQMVHKASPEERKLELISAFEEGAKWDAAQKYSWSRDDEDNIVMIESRLTDLLSYTREDSSLTKHRKNSIKEEVVGYVNWLTSLKDRHTWKPSDEQMDALEHFVRSIGESGYASPYDNAKSLYSLLEQLKKLRGE